MLIFGGWLARCLTPVSNLGRFAGLSTDLSLSTGEVSDVCLELNTGTNSATCLLSINFRLVGVTLILFPRPTVPPELLIAEILLKYSRSLVVEIELGLEFNLES